jgi:hypothetical protein
MSFWALMERFYDDARKTFGQAITEAEKSENKGVLKLLRFRDGKTENVELKLRVMGSYSATAPYDCPKSKLIFEEACKALEKEPLEQNLWGAVNGLALLATGKAEYLPKVQAFARKMGSPTLKLELKEGMGMVVWDWGYKNLFLCEYYLLTGDKEVLHAINEYTVALAKGQGMYGTFGHGISDRTADGKFHGSIPPYGPVNQSGLIGNLAIVMGKKCGVNDPEVVPAIDRATKFSATLWTRELSLTANMSRGPTMRTMVRARSRLSSSLSREISLRVHASLRGCRSPPIPIASTATRDRASVICGARSAPTWADLRPRLHS